MTPLLSALLNHPPMALGNPTVFQRIICQPGWMASHFLSLPSNLRTVALDSQTFAGCVGFPRGLEEERHARMDTGKCNIEFPQGLRGWLFLNRLPPTSFTVPSDKSTSWGSEVRAIYINLITRNDVTSALNTVSPPPLALFPLACSILRRVSTPNAPRDSEHSFASFLASVRQPAPVSCTSPTRKTDLRYMIDSKKLLSRPRS